MQDWSAIDAHISACLGRNFRTSCCQSLSGGCINTAWQIRDDYNVFLVKLNSPHHNEMFAAEFEGLQALRSSSSIRVPEPVTCGVCSQHAFLVTEFIPMDNHFSAASLGEQLASMHHSTAECYGWHRDNTIGSTPQHNGQRDDWVAFWRHNRLGFQLQLSKNNGYNGLLLGMGYELSEMLPAFFTNYTPDASLLHGDLWSGNINGCDGQPVIYDPAVYFGDRETDLAMTELFGGLPRSFYDAYHSNWPLDSGYSVRKQLYNLYHMLNHLNLFGSGYHRQCLQLLQSLLAELK
ncbi:MAG: fructosamine kinase family protein [Gammaproteobacteria bacterium]|nr:fructosamine kinase family protein [Gammaproteobacteria bacterium]